nr:hypothetical protein [Kocuria carniphila]
MDCASARPHAAIAVTERVDGLELSVADSYRNHRGYRVVRDELDQIIHDSWMWV